MHTETEIPKATGSFTTALQTADRGARLSLLWAFAMLNYLLQRVATIVPTLFFVSILIFSLQHLLPGDPALVMAGEERDPAVIEQIRQELLLARRFAQRCFAVVGRGLVPVAPGEFGNQRGGIVSLLDGVFYLLGQVGHGAQGGGLGQFAERGFNQLAGCGFIEV